MGGGGLGRELLEAGARAVLEGLRGRAGAFGTPSLTELSVQFQTGEAGPNPRRAELIGQSSTAELQSEDSK